MSIEEIIPRPTVEEARLSMFAAAHAFKFIESWIKGNPDINELVSFSSYWRDLEQAVPDPQDVMSRADDIDILAMRIESKEPE